MNRSGLTENRFHRIKRLPDHFQAPEADFSILGIMLVHTLIDYAEQTFDTLLRLSEEEPSLFVATCIFISAWISWRLWRFIIAPCLNPDDPRELPYWIPSESGDALGNRFS